MLKIQHLQDIEWIHPGDAALDLAHPDYSYGEYLKTWDRKHLPVRAGFTPSVFKLRRLGMKVQQHCFRQPHVPDRDREFVAYSVKGVTDFDENAGELVLKFEKGEFGEQRLADESLEKIYSWDLFRELGASAMIFNSLRP